MDLQTLTSSASTLELILARVSTPKDTPPKKLPQSLMALTQRQPQVHTNCVFFFKIFQTRLSALMGAIMEFVRILQETRSNVHVAFLLVMPLHP